MMDRVQKVQGTHEASAAGAGIIAITKAIIERVDIVLRRASATSRVGATVEGVRSAVRVVYRGTIVARTSVSLR